jgi:antitoxin PrlF
MIAMMRAKRQLTIPARIRRAVHLEEGDGVEFNIVVGGILLRPKKMADAAQAWFWTEEWQAGEREASADNAAGWVTRYDSDDDLVAALS